MKANYQLISIENEYSTKKVMLINLKPNKVKYSSTGKRLPIIENRYCYQKMKGHHRHVEHYHFNRKDLQMQKTFSR